MANKFEQALTHKLGPLPVWVWALIGGGAFFLFSLLKGGSGGGGGSTPAAPATPALPAVPAAVPAPVQSPIGSTDAIQVTPYSQALSAAEQAAIAAEQAAALQNAAQQAAAAQANAAQAVTDQVTNQNNNAASMSLGTFQTLLKEDQALYNANHGNAQAQAAAHTAAEALRSQAAQAGLGTLVMGPAGYLVLQTPSGQQY